MTSRSLRRGLKINWWLWAGLSLPPILYFLLQKQEEKGGGFYRDLGELKDYLTRRDWSLFYSWEILVPDVLIPLATGWVLQYFIMMAWERWRKYKRVNAT